VLGVATFTANNLKETAWTAEGKLVHTTRRDSAPPALHRGSWGPRAQHEQAAAATATLPRPPPDPAAEARAAEQREAERQLAEQRRHALAAKARATESRQAEAAQAELRFRTAWLAGLRARQLQPAAGPSAAERLEALRGRLRLTAAARL